MTIGYYNTWTEEIFDSSEIDEDTTSTEIANTEDSVSEMSPGHGPSHDMGTSRGLDFISSSGYPQIEFGYDGETEEEEEDSDDDDSTSLDGHGHNGKTSPVKHHLVRDRLPIVPWTTDVLLALYFILCPYITTSRQCLQSRQCC